MGSRGVAKVLHPQFGTQPPLALLPSPSTPLLSPPLHPPLPLHKEEEDGAGGCEGHRCEHPQVWGHG